MNPLMLRVPDTQLELDAFKERLDDLQINYDPDGKIQPESLDGLRRGELKGEAAVQSVVGADGVLTAEASQQLQRAQKGASLSRGRDATVDEKATQGVRDLAMNLEGLNRGLRGLLVKLEGNGRLEPKDWTAVTNRLRDYKTKEAKHFPKNGQLGRIDSQVVADFSSKLADTTEFASKLLANLSETRSEVDAFAPRVLSKSFIAKKALQFSLDRAMNLLTLTQEMADHASARIIQRESGDGPALDVYTQLANKLGSGILSRDQVAQLGTTLEQLESETSHSAEAIAMHIGSVVAGKVLVGRGRRTRTGALASLINEIIEVDTPESEQARVVAAAAGDRYALLGVRRDATTNELIRALQKKSSLALGNSPELESAWNELFTNAVAGNADGVAAARQVIEGDDTLNALVEAFETLSTAGARKQYDQAHPAAGTGYRTEAEASTLGFPENELDYGEARAFIVDMVSQAARETTPGDLHNLISIAKDNTRVAQGLVRRARGLPVSAFRATLEKAGCQVDPKLSPLDALQALTATQRTTVRSAIIEQLQDSKELRSHPAYSGTSDECLEALINGEHLIPPGEVTEGVASEIQEALDDAIEIGMIKEGDRALWTRRMTDSKGLRDQTLRFGPYALEGATVLGMDRFQQVHDHSTRQAAHTFAWVVLGRGDWSDVKSTLDTLGPARTAELLDEATSMFDPVIGDVEVEVQGQLSLREAAMLGRLVGRVWGSGAFDVAAFARAEGALALVELLEAGDERAASSAILEAAVALHEANGALRDVALSKVDHARAVSSDDASADALGRFEAQYEAYGVFVEHPVRQPQESHFRDRRERRAAAVTAMADLVQALGAQLVGDIAASDDSDPGPMVDGVMGAMKRVLSACDELGTSRENVVAALKQNVPEAPEVHAELDRRLEEL